MLDKDEILEQVRMLVENSGMNTVELAAKCGLPEATARRALADGKNPSFIVLCEIIKACGGSIDAVVGIDHAATVQPNEPLLRQLKSDLEHERRGRKFNMRLFLIAMFILVAVLIVDLMNPQLGWIRYNAQQAAYQVKEAVAVIMCALGLRR